MFDSLVTFGYTQAINFTAGGSGDNTIKAIGAGKKFVITYLHLEASASIDLIIKSGSTALTGAVAITTTTVLDFESSGAPILKAAAAGDDFIINVSGAADVDGWAFMAEVDQ